MTGFMIIIGFGITYAAIVGLGSLSGMFSERSGIVNIGINGMMIVGALAYAIFSYKFKNAPQGAQFLGYVIAMLAAGAYALLHALACIKFKADQIISGTAINILALGLALIIIKVITKQDNITVKLDDIKFAKTGWGNQFGINIIIAIGVFVLGWFAINRTKWGLRFRSVGENPAATDSAGINVYLKQYQGVALSGAIAGLAGAFFAQKIYVFSGNVQGLGFLSLAIMIMGQWRTYWAGIASIIFGVLIGFALYLSTNPDYVSWLGKYSELTKAIPFILTLVVMILTSKTSRGPKASGKIYDKAVR